MSREWTISRHGSESRASGQRLAAAVLSLLALLGAACPLPAQGLLERMRQATHEGRYSPPPSASPPSQRLPPPSPNYVSGLGGSGEAVGIIGLGAAIVATSPFWGPFLLLGDNLAVPGYFPSYPYGYTESSYLHLDFNGTTRLDQQEAPFGDPDYLRSWSVRLAADGGDNFAGLTRLDGRFLFDTTARIGLQCNWHYYHEDLGGGRSDQTLMHDTEVMFRFVQREWINMYTGLGYQMLTDRSTTRAGFNFEYGADVFLIDPVVLSASVDLGNLDAAFVVHCRSTLGINFHNLELLTGYDFLRIGPVNLQGPLVGLRFWF